MALTVYIETTIPSYYVDKRAELVREIARTRQWWDRERVAYECFVSQFVLEELEQGRESRSAARLALVADIPLLAFRDEVLEVAEVYWAHKLMPRLPVRDALHLAMASYYKLDVLLTWNCRHLANVNKAAHLARINRMLNLPVPILATPWQLELPEE